MVLKFVNVMGSKESEAEVEYVDSGLPPPRSYTRRNSRTNIEFERSITDHPTRSTLSRAHSMPALQPFDESHCTETTGEADLANASETEKNKPGASQNNTGEYDLFQERKKKLRTPVMAQSMPEIRNIRALYNRGVGKAIHDICLEANCTVTDAPAFDGQAFDQLMAGL